MPTVYVNGGAPYYKGFGFTTTQALLEKIRDELVNAGWVTSVDQIVASSRVLMKATDNGHDAFIEFRSVQTSGITYTLRVRGDLTGNGANLSSDALTITYHTTRKNYLYLAADSAGGCLGIYSATTAATNLDGAMISVHFGFLNRLDNTDSNAWMVGYLYGGHYGNAYVARSKHDNTIWRLLSAVYSSNTVISGSNAVGPYQSIFDRYTICVYPHQRNFADTNNPNAGYLAYNGRLNYDSKPVIAEDFYYVEGRASTTNYPGQLYYRGNVRFAITGVASRTSGVICVNKAGRRYISGGGAAWQGFAITA